ncbi:hypothetical protein DSL72_004363 [Monilinia vaccinii-corymbosi]|uniref:Uncharacterized protein n=1 Tax=Monilinia vaccinii-corymbosi TaxID=61207 RepID=A0A8A3NVV8_9HELO|nr:hypothetical protein DSL72_004363 [Monilinia vaccinii-corymbosi]
MLSTRDQENLVHGHQQAAANKPLNQSTRSLQPKTPGNRFPKTPLKLPLNDENATGGLGGKGTVLGTKGKGLGGKDAILDKNSYVTPLGKNSTRYIRPVVNLKGPRNRAPLGMKTTNAKTKVFQTPAGPAPEKELEKTVSKQTSARRPKHKVSEKIKIDVHGDESPLRDVEVEYMPPRSKDLPYDSDVFSTGCLNYDMLKPENLTKGALGDYYNTNDKSGKSKLARDLKKSSVERAKKADKQILASMEEGWTVADVPETLRNPKKRGLAQQTKTTVLEDPKPKAATQNKGPTAVSSRRAASALSTLPRSVTEPSKRPLTAAPRPATSFLARSRKTPTFAPVTNASMRATAAVANSRSTIGYTKGRSASNILQKKDVPSVALEKRENATLPRSISNLSHDSDSTITPARFAQKENLREAEYKTLDFLRAFDVDDEELEPAVKCGLPECSMEFNEDEEEFVMTIGDAE